eukprot:NODE_483_length_6934_cov_0.583175.p1 type:complete len:230 gc:universal NODE_483_length_6934_cov_0.583175:2936-3625(+)
MNNFPTTTTIKPIDLTQQIQITTESKQIGTAKLYKAKLKGFIEFIEDAGYSLDITTSQHPILIAQYLHQSTIKHPADVNNSNTVYYSERHWYNTWSALADHYNTFLVAGWAKEYEQHDIATILDIFVTPPINLNLRMLSNPLDSIHVKTRKSLLKKINLNSERSKASDILLPGDLYSFRTFDFSLYDHSEGMLFYSFGDICDLKWKNVKFGISANPDDPSQIVQFIQIK